MGKKRRAAKTDKAGPGVEEADVPETPGEYGNPMESLFSTGSPTSSTLSAPSGKSYVLAQETFSTDVPRAMKNHVVTASAGDLLELLLMQGNWGYGKRFKPTDGAVNEGVFKLDWVNGVRLVLEDGKRRPVEVDIVGPEFGYQPPRASDAPSKLRLKRYRNKISEAEQAMGVSSSSAVARTDHANDVSKKEKIAAKNAQELLLRDEAETKARNARAERRKTDRKQSGGGRHRGILGEGEVERGVDASDKCHDVSPGGSDKCQDGSPGGGTSGGDAGSETSLAGGGSSPEAVTNLELPSSPIASVARGRPISDQVWEAQWEQQAAHLENIFSASSSGVEESLSDGGQIRQKTVRKHILNRKAAKSLLKAKRSGELAAIAEEWEKAHSEMASKACDMNAWNEKVKRKLSNANEDEIDVNQIAEEMASEAESKAAEVKALKERVFRAMIALKRSKDVEKTACDMDDAQKVLEMKAAQLKGLLRRAWRGMVESKRTSELEKIADEMAEQLNEKAASLKLKIRDGLLRAHRTGELQEIRDELDELADSVAVLDVEAGAMDRSECRSGASASQASLSKPPGAPLRRRWADIGSSDSDSSQALWPRTVTLGDKPVQPANQEESVKK